MFSLEECQALKPTFKEPLNDVVDVNLSFSHGLSDVFVFLPLKFSNTKFNRWLTQTTDKATPAPRDLNRREMEPLSLGQDQPWPCVALTVAGGYLFDQQFQF